MFRNTRSTLKKLLSIDVYLYNSVWIQYGHKGLIEYGHCWSGRVTWTGSGNAVCLDVCLRTITTFRLFEHPHNGG
jgi:hypothetical protein